MPLAIEQTPRARSDLLDIWLFIAADSETAADRTLRRIDSVLHMLAEQPLAGRARSELAPDIRSFPVGNYIVYYAVSPQAIVVVRVLERHRDIDAIFDEASHRDISDE